MNKRIILASKSPRRSELLKQIGIEFTVMVSDADENISESNPKDYVMSLSKIKASAVYDEILATSDDIDDMIIIGADTIVVLGDKILGKPKDTADAIATLKSLSGKVHEVMTGVTVIDVVEGEPQYYTFYEATKVHMYEMSEEEIIAYVSSHEPDDKAGIRICDTTKTLPEWADKAGGYAIQGTVGHKFIKGIDGDYYNVGGLPIASLYQKLKELHINL